MRILVAVLEAADPGFLLGDERLANIRRLMEFGCYGRLEDPGCAGADLAWICMGAGREANAPQEPRAESPACIWEYLAGLGRRAVLFGIAPPFPQPVVLQPRAERLDVEYPLEPEAISPAGSHGLDCIQALSRVRFGAIRHVLQTQQWDYLQFADPAPAQIRRFVPCDAYAEAASAHYLYWDQELGSLLELLAEPCAILVVSARGNAAAPDTPGSFVLAEAGNRLTGEIKGARLIDMAPTLLAIGGYDVPSWMQGTSLLVGKTVDQVREAGLSDDEEQLLRERLSGLGYL